MHTPVKTLMTKHAVVSLRCYMLELTPPSCSPGSLLGSLACQLCCTHDSADPAEPACNTPNSSFTPYRHQSSKGSLAIRNEPAAALPDGDAATVGSQQLCSLAAHGNSSTCLAVVEDAPGRLGHER